MVRYQGGFSTLPDQVKAAVVTPIDRVRFIAISTFWLFPDVEIPARIIGCILLESQHQGSIGH